LDPKRFDTIVVARCAPCKSLSKATTSRSRCAPEIRCSEALLRAGVAFPFSCQAGNCGTCKCELVSGEILELEHSEHALAPERARKASFSPGTQVWDDAVIRRIVPRPW